VAAVTCVRVVVLVQHIELPRWMYINPPGGSPSIKGLPGFDDARCLH